MIIDTIQLGKCMVPGCSSSYSIIIVSGHVSCYLILLYLESAAENIVMYSISFPIRIRAFFLIEHNYLSIRINESNAYKHNGPQLPRLYIAKQPLSLTSLVKLPHK